MNRIKKKQGLENILVEPQEKIEEKPKIRTKIYEEIKSYFPYFHGYLANASFDGLFLGKY